jgi:cell division protein FtsL
MSTIHPSPRHQRPHREQDPRVRRSFLTALACAALLVVVGLGLVALRVHEVQIAYRLDAVRAERARTERLVRQLEIEVATLSAPSRLESRARELGMTMPVRNQVRLAREYVPTATGTAASARVARDEAIVR